MFSYKNVHQQANIFNKPIIYIFSNFIPNILVTFDDKDSPWMTEKLKEKIKWKDKVYRDCTSSKTYWSIPKHFTMVEKYQYCHHY